MPRKEVDARNIQRCKRLLPTFASMAELIIFSVLSNPIPAFKSDCAIPAVIVPSTAARPPVPMPSLKTEIYARCVRERLGAIAAERRAVCCVLRKAALHGINGLLTHLQL